MIPSFRLIAALSILCCLFGTPILLGIFIEMEIENVPIERVLQNLERRAREYPRDVQTRINLGRIHAMAYASNAETAPVLKSRNPNDPPEPEFGVITSQFANLQITRPSDSAAVIKGRDHLTKAIEQYEAAIAIDPSNMIARLGRAWCQHQLGERQAALAGYRALLSDSFAKESAGELPDFSNFMPMTEEVSQYLLALLDPVQDAAEIREIHDRVRTIQFAMAVRPVTPIAIPLEDGAPVSSLVNHSKTVVFDADGSGVPRSWSWITPKAGWLVFDKHGGKAPTSALSLFGSVTFWLFWDNGYAALQSLDDDGNGRLEGAELEGLALWQDINQNGKSDPGEVDSLASWRILSLSCKFEWVEDDVDVTAWSEAGVTFEGGVVRPTYDLLLYPKQTLRPQQISSVR